MSEGTRERAGAEGDPAAVAAAPERLPAWQWALRLLWIAIEIILVCWFAQKGLMFVYQGF